MKNLAKSVLLIALPVILLFACKKDEDRVVFKNGAAPALTSSVTTLALVETDSAKQGVKLTWSNPNYSFNNTGSSLKVGYTVEIDSTGKNFAKPQTLSLTDILEKTYTVAEFNQLLLKIGLKHSVQGSVDVRVTSALYVPSSKVVSNVVTLKVTPYNVKPKPVIPPPAKLFIVGDATAGGWNNPVPVPAQELTQIDENTFGTIIQLTGGKEYLLLPVNGDWSHKYSLSSKTDPALKAGGKFLYDAPENFPGPTATGTYKIIVSFLTGEYTVTPVAPADLPTNLYIVGDATPKGWDNFASPNQPFTKKNDFTFEITIALTGGKEYLILPVAGSWDHKYAVDSNTDPELKLGGIFKYDAPKNFPGPTESGNYKIVVSFLNNSYKLTKL